METFAKIGQAVDAVLRLAYTDVNPVGPSVKEELAKIIATPNPVDTVYNSAELLYAHKDGLSDYCLGLCAALTSFATQYGFHQITVNDRGPKMIMALRRQLGHTHPLGEDWPDASEDPAPLPKFVAEEPETEEES